MEGKEFVLEFATINLQTRIPQLLRMDDHKTGVQVRGEA